MSDQPAELNEDARAWAEVFLDESPDVDLLSNARRVEVALDGDHPKAQALAAAIEALPDSDLEQAKTVCRLALQSRHNSDFSQGLDLLEGIARVAPPSAVVEILQGVEIGRFGQENVLIRTNAMEDRLRLSPAEAGSVPFDLAIINLMRRYDAASRQQVRTGAVEMS